MKKIIGAVVASSLLAASVFAVGKEPAVSMKYRTQADLYKTTSVKDGKATTDVLDLDGEGNAKDELAFKYNTDYAGVVIDFNVDATGSTAVAFDQYYGWMLFGGLKLTSGEFDSRFTDRVADSIGEISIYDANKLGLIKGETNSVDNDSKLGVDSDNFSNKNLALVGDYTFKFDGGSFLLKAGAVESTFSQETDESKDRTTVDSGFAVEGALTLDETLSLDLVFKKPASDQVVFGAFVKPLMVEKLNAVVGFTFASDSKDYDSTDTKSLNNGDKLSAYAFDARLSYQISDALIAMAGVNFSNWDYDAYDDPIQVLRVEGEVAYTVNDKVAIALDAVYENGDVADIDSADKSDAFFQVQPHVVLTAGKGATISTGFSYKSYLDADTGTDESEIKVPFVFRVAL